MRRFPRFAVVVTAAAVGLVTVTPPASADPVAAPTAPVTAAPADGTLSLTSTGRAVGDDLTFHFTTSTADTLNWIAVYDDPADGPTDQTFHAASTVWEYVPGTSGDLTLSSASLGVGTHAAYLLYDDGYTWLAQPITFTLTAPPPAPNPHFVVNAFTTAPVPIGGSASQPLAGLWTGGAASDFTKVAGPNWLTVGHTGVVSAAPTSTAGTGGSITVLATDRAGRRGRIEVDVPTRRGAVPTLRTATWNLWDAGRHVDGGVDKQIAAILGARLDVVGLQETAGTSATVLASRLGWYAYQPRGDVGILSRYPLTPGAAPTSLLHAASATVSVGGRSVRVWTARLDTTGYGPYSMCFGGRTAPQVQAAETTTLRFRQAKALTAAMGNDLFGSARTPVVLLADVASPSTPDWTPTTAASHCGVRRTTWPVTDLLTGAGLVDTYRAAHSDPAADPGTTWSPVVTTHTGTGAAEPHDRTDVVDAAGLAVAESHVLLDGFPHTTTGAVDAPLSTAPGVDPSVGSNLWPSDHAAVVTTFTLR